MPFASEDLFNIIARKQLYVEAVKSYAATTVVDTTTAIADDLRKVFGRLKYENLGDMSKLEIRVLIDSVKQINDKYFDSWLEALIQLLQEFVEIDYSMTKQIIGSFEDESEDLLSEDEADKQLNAIITFNTLWSRITGATMFATGVTIIPFLRGFVTAAKAAQLAALNKALVGNSTPAEALADLTAPVTGPGTGGVVSRLPTQAKGVLDTTFQHGSQQATNEVLKKQYNKYQWVSVLDSRTTEICKELNGKIFIYGQGPLPPAHINCRSDVAPVVDDVPADYTDFSVYDWLREQSDAIKKEILGKSGAELLNAGEMTEDELRKKLKNVPALTPTEFKKRTKLIYTGN